LSVFRLQEKDAATAINAAAHVNAENRLGMNTRSPVKEKVVRDPAFAAIAAEGEC
jgi:hypothetical protein